jgi:hypothetical protein
VVYSGYQDQIQMENEKTQREYGLPWLDYELLDAGDG